MKVYIKRLLEKLFTVKIYEKDSRLYNKGKLVGKVKESAIILDAPIKKNWIMRKLNIERLICFYYEQ